MPFASLTWVLLKLRICLLTHPIKSVVQSRSKIIATETWCTITAMLKVTCLFSRLATSLQKARLQKDKYRNLHGVLKPWSWSSLNIAVIVHHVSVAIILYLDCTTLSIGSFIRTQVSKDNSIRRSQFMFWSKYLSRGLEGL